MKMVKLFLRDRLTTPDENPNKLQCQKYDHALLSLGLLWNQA